jgi:tetratricopeptide (TPR) repeat protein
MGCCPAWVSLFWLALLPPFPPQAALEWWQRGEQAIEANDPDRAIRCYQQSLSLAPGLARNHLSLAVACLEKGEDDRAVDHLARYLDARPGEVLVRGQLAELLVGLGRVEEAARQQERFIADLQADEGLAEQYLVDAHTRRMELAREQKDDYREHLERGIALYRLGRQRAEAPDAGGELPAEGLFLQAADELRQAGRVRASARTSWYLSQVWAALGRQHPARGWLRAAWSRAPFDPLTPTERDELCRAWRAYRDEPNKK